jgi:hypothetical protein
MTSIFTEEELYRSCNLIFGRNLKVTREFLNYLQLSGIKKAYRKKALEFHPDLTCSENQLIQQNRTARFIDVHQAYEILINYLKEREKGICHQAGTVQGLYKKDQKQPHAQAYKSPRNQKAKQKRTNQFHYRAPGSRKKPINHIPVDPATLYKGPIPDCSLLFGRYLYYSGIINLQIIGQALVWQRSQRPRLGEIGIRLGWLSMNDTHRVLKYRRGSQLFGESALNLGLLNMQQLKHMIVQQKKLHKRFGQYFVAKNYWDLGTLEDFIMLHRNHNARAQDRFAQTM